MKMWLLRVAKPGFQEHSQGVILTARCSQGLEDVVFPAFCSSVL